MDLIFAGQPAAHYRPITRSFRLRGHSTSVRLEAKVWQIIDEIAAARGMSTPRFLACIHEEMEQRYGSVRNFASLLRCACLLYLEQPRGTLAQARSEERVTGGAVAH